MHFIEAADNTEQTYHKSLEKANKKVEKSS